MQRPRPDLTIRPPVGIMFDTALGRIDDALAMALLYGLEARKDLRVVSMSVSRSSLHAAMYCDAVGRFYAGPVGRAVGFNGRSLPVGLSPAGSLKDDLPFFVAPLDRRDAEGKPQYVSDVHGLADTAVPAALIRNAFTAQFDNNAVVVVSGPATLVAKLLDVGGARDLITRKVKFLVLAAGAFSGGDSDPNIKADIPAARKLFAEWPTPIVLSGREIGRELPFPAASIEKDFAWAPAHPVVDAYRANQSMPYDAPTAAMAAVLYASHPQDGYFKLSEPGVVSVLDDGRTTFAASGSGKQRYLVLDAAQKDRVISAYTEVASAKPVPPPRRPTLAEVLEQRKKDKDQQEP